LIHDLKKCGLNPWPHVGENLPNTFNNPAFREDAFRGIGSAASRINDLINRMNALRHELRLKAGRIGSQSRRNRSLTTLNGTLENKLVTKF